MNFAFWAITHLSLFFYKMGKILLSLALHKPLASTAPPSWVKAMPHCKASSEKPPCPCHIQESCPWPQDCHLPFSVGPTPPKPERLEMVMEASIPHHSAWDTPSVEQEKCLPSQSSAWHARCPSHWLLSWKARGIATSCPWLSISVEVWNLPFHRPLKHQDRVYYFTPCQSHSISNPRTHWPAVTPPVPKWQQWAAQICEFMANFRVGGQILTAQLFPLPNAPGSSQVDPFVCSPLRPILPLGPGQLALRLMWALGTLSSLSPMALGSVSCPRITRTGGDTQA